jgi:hypothetical protein
MIPSLPFIFLNKKAISRLLSEFLLIIISLSIVSLAGLFLNAYSKSLSYNPRIEIIEARAISWARGILIKVNVANVGNVKLTLTNVKSTHPNIGDISPPSVPIPLEPSQSYEVEKYISLSFPIGTKLTIIASASTPDGKTIQVIKNVEVMP